MLELFEGMTVFGAIAVNIAAITGALQLKPGQRLIVAAGAGAWVGLATILAARGALVYSPTQPAPIVGILFGTPLIATTIAFFMSSKVRQLLLDLPLGLLVGLNSLRIFGAMFIVHAMLGGLSGPFPYSAGIGDVITAIGAAVIARGIMVGRPPSTRLIARWNAFGTLDLFAAVALGLTSANGSPLQLFHVGVGSAAMQVLPFALVPTALVPFYLITHGLVAAKLKHRLTNETPQAVAVKIQLAA